jgi:hypothetical protein
LGRKEIFTDQSFDAGPHVGIAFDRDVSLKEVAREPGISRAGFRLFLVIESIVAEDLSSLGIRWQNFRRSVQESTRLIKVNRAGYIGGNDAVILTGFCDAIDLDS